LALPEPACSECSLEFPGNAKFCPQCGTPAARAGEDDINRRRKEAKSGTITRIKAVYCVDEGEYEFESEDDRDEFISSPTFHFDFNLDNVDDKDGVERIFGTVDVTPDFRKEAPKFSVTRLEASEADGAVAIVSVEVEMFFDVKVSLEDFLDWVENEGETWQYSGRIGCTGETGLINSEREKYEAYFEVPSYLGSTNGSLFPEVFQKVKEQLSDASGLTIFISYAEDFELLDSLINDLKRDDARLVRIKNDANYMDYVMPLLEVEDGATAILDGVQNIQQAFHDDFIRIVSDRVLVGTIGEGDKSRSFEKPMNSFNLVLIDRGGGKASDIKDAADMSFPNGK
jgi:hypothetical protein